MKSSAILEPKSIPASATSCQDKMRTCAPVGPGKYILTGLKVLKDCGLLSWGPEISHRTVLMADFSTT